MLVLSPQTSQSLAPLTRGRGSVVFIQAQIPGLTPILIRATTEPAQLLREIDQASPVETYWIGWIPNDSARELASALGEQNAKTRIRGDWYEPSAELLAYVAHVALPPLRELVAQLHPNTKTNGLATIEEIADYLGVSVPTVRRWVAADRIPVLRVGRQLRFVLADVIASLQRGG